MSKRTTSRKSPKKPRKVAPATGNFKEINFQARAKRELAKIAAALDAIPAAAEPFRRMAQSEELFPYNHIASSEPVQDVILGLVAGRDSGTAWIPLYHGLSATDETGNGFTAFMDAYRDAAFQVGVEYVLRAFPDWWPLMRFLSDDTIHHLGVIVRAAANNALHGKDGE